MLDPFSPDARLPSAVPPFDAAASSRFGGSSPSIRLLITGDPGPLAAVLPVVDRHFPSPVHLYDATSIGLLPCFARGTLLLSGIDRFTASDQDRLYDWFNEHGAAHRFIVTMSAVPLWPLVQRGAFRVDLFYRLNLMSIAAQVDSCLARDVAAAAGAMRGGDRGSGSAV
jgi:hypothetical protein